MNIWKKILGISLAVGLSISMSIAPVYEIAISGLTQCHRTCSKVYLSLYLERKVNGSYGTYKYWNFTANNVHNLSKTIEVIVPSGTYYRVRGYHAASQSGTKESTSTLTQGIMVK